MRRTAALAALGAATALSLAATPALASGSHAPIEGSGSSWAANAVNQWVADVEQEGLHVDFTPSGSAVGRKDFANQTTDFAVSDIGFLGTDPATGESDTSQGRAYAYLPIVAGGTAFPYQVRQGGQLVRNIRLSGLTLAKIFTNQITNWDDAAITRDNNGRRLPSLPIIPVVHSEGSGSTYQFTRYLAKQFPSLWKGYAGFSSPTEYYPKQGTNMVAQNGSDGVMNFLTSSAGDGAIAYDEYSYALGKNYPVAKIENKAGYFTAPTQYNVAVALTQAKINYDKSSPDYLLQNLDYVYSYGDKRTYPMSSYSYMIIPTASDDARMGSTSAKRQTIVDFVSHSICEGQAEIGPIGYSPLPINLVQRSFEQVALLKKADPGVDLTNRTVSSCHNPTFIAGQPKRNYLAEIAPQPPACDQAGHGPCTGREGLANGNPTGGHATAGNTGRSGGTRAGNAGPGTAVKGSSAGAVGALPSGGATTTSVDPLTGQPVVADSGAQAGTLLGAPTDLPSGASDTNVLSGLVAGELLVLLMLPPLLARWLARRKAAAR